MILSDRTISILKNYATINPNISFEKGNVLRSLAGARDIYSVANIEEEIPRDFSIYNLNQLLSCLSLADTPDITFDEKSLMFNDKFGEPIIYYYTNDDIIEKPPTKTVEVDGIFSFELKAEKLLHLLKVSSVLAAPDFSVLCDGKDVILKIHDRKNPTSHSRENKVGEFNEEFHFHVKVENIKIIPTDYIVTVATTKTNAKSVLHIKSTDESIQYWIACGI